MKNLLRFTASLVMVMVLQTAMAQSSGSKKSTVREFINKSEQVLIELDLSREAAFYSGIGEYVKFYPVTITNLKTGEKENGVLVKMYIYYYTDSNVKKKFYYDAYIGKDEIKDFINFIEKFVIPNLDETTDSRKQKKFYVFQAKEITMTYLVTGKKHQIQIKLNFTEDAPESYVFWTNTQVKKVKDLVEMLKTLI